MAADAGGSHRGTATLMENFCCDSTPISALMTVAEAKGEVAGRRAGAGPQAFTKIQGFSVRRGGWSRTREASIPGYARSRH